MIAFSLRGMQDYLEHFNLRVFFIIKSWHNLANIHYTGISFVAYDTNSLRLV